MNDPKKVLQSVARTFLAFTLITFLIISILIGLNTLMILSADTLTTEDKNELNKISELKIYDFPNTRSDKDVVEKSRLNYHRDSFEKASSIQSRLTRKYDAEKKIIITERSVQYNLQTENRTVLTESVTYLGSADNQTRRINRTIVSGRSSTEQTTSNCGLYTTERNLYEVEFNSNRYDSISKYFPNRWNYRSENSESMEGINQFVINSSNTNRSNNELYALSDYEGSFQSEENGSEEISISQDMRMATEPILALTPLNTDISVQYEYNRTVRSDAHVEEPNWVDEARDCIQSIDSES